MNTLYEKTRAIINKYNIRADKKLGQNFLIDQNVLGSIIEAAEITKDDIVIEVGPGLGVLTAELCKKAKKVIAIELDRKFVDILQDVLRDYNNWILIRDDVLKINLKELLEQQEVNQKVKVIANLPYYITTPVIMKFLEEGPIAKELVIMVQKEVAHRISAKPGGKEYGALTLAVGFYGTSRIVKDVPPSSFIPAPGVVSSVLKINIAEEPMVSVKNDALFFKVVKASFGQRRKTILNSLTNSGIFSNDKARVSEILEKAGIEENRRPETLNINEFAKLANSFGD